MAEIVGALASGITILGASIKAADGLLDFISQVRNAPEEISFLHDEVTNTKLLLLNIKENTNQDQWLQTRLALPDVAGISGNPEHVPQADNLIRRIDRTLALINLALRDVSKSNSHRGVTIRYGGWLLNRSKIKSLRSELHELKTSLNTHFCTNTGSLAVRSVVLLKRVLLESSTRAQQGLIRNDQVDMTLQNLTQNLTKLHTLRDTQKHLVTAMEILNQNIANSKEERETVAAMSTCQRNHSWNGRTLKQLASPDRTSVSNLPATSTTPQFSTESALRVRFEFSSRACVYDCQCTCHQRQRYKSPSFAQKLLGEMFIGISNLPSFMQPCSNTRCRQRSPFSLVVTYYLPTSFFSTMVSLLCVTTSHGDLALCLKVRPSNPDFSLYRAVKKNDVEMVKRMIERCASLASATFRCGWTPLHYAVTHGHVAMCKFLIAAGADPSFEDSSNEQSPLEWAWIKILGSSYSPSTQREMELLFSDRTPVASLRLPPLHRIILGLKPLPPSFSSLSAYLTHHPHTINDRDAAGRTALSWAAQRGMSSTISLLLSHGADPNLCSSKGHSALQYAASAQSPSCIPLLLAAGADVHQPDVEGQTALHYAAMHHSDLAYYIPLVAAGAHIDAQTRHAETPLSTAISQGHGDAVRYLVQIGADPSLRTFEQRSPVFNAVETNSYAALAYLLGVGAGYNVPSTEWPSIAHVAAVCADVRTLGILAEARLEVQAWWVVDREGRTVERIVEGRMVGMQGVGREEWEWAWRVFWGGVVGEGKGRAAWVEEVEGEGEESEDVFYDAVEELGI